MKSSVPLSDVAELIDSLHKTPKYSDSGKPMVRVTDVKYGNLDLSKTLKVSNEVFEEFSRRYTPKKGDIVITRVGTYGVSAKVKETNFCMGQNISVIIPKKICPNYLYSFLNSSNAKQQIESSVVGSTQKTLSLKAINALRVPRFNDEVEFKIGKIHSTFDQKIHVNNLINSKLEKISQTLFQSWFVDFDPVYAKKGSIDAGLTKVQAERAAMAVIAGICSPSESVENFEEMDKNLSAKLSKMSKDKQEMLAHTASLFPSDFEDSENGSIPKGFKTKLISDIADVIGGGTPSTKVEEYFCGKGTGIPWLSPKDLSGYDWKYISNGATDITELGLKKSSAKLMPKGTIIISSRAPIGYVAIAEGELSTNQGFKSLVPLQDIGSNFLYNWAKSNVVAMEAVATGSTFKEISGTNMKNLKVVVPNKDLIRRFEELVEHNSELQKNLRHETNNLECLRDTLLPKFLAGEIDLSEVSLD